MTELARLARLARLFAGPAPGVSLGIGDDAAVLEPPAGRRLVWTIDEQVEGTHFRTDLVGWEDLGWRAFMAAASDLAAMGAEPWCALSALTLSDAVDDAALDALAAGQRAAAAAVGAAIVGGNLARGATIAVTTTLLGTCERAVARGGARAGDGIWLAGSVGLAAAGLRALLAGARDPRLDPAVLAWRRPRALIAEGLAMSTHAHAAIDVSDGLARDLGHVARASGLRAVLDADALAEAALVAAAEALGADPLELALHGGEDYALVVASEEPIAGFRKIGELADGAGLALRRDGRETSLAAVGFDHFAR